MKLKKANATNTSVKNPTTKYSLCFPSEGSLDCCSDIDSSAAEFDFNATDWEVADLHVFLTECQTDFLSQKWVESRVVGMMITANISATEDSGVFVKIETSPSLGEEAGFTSFSSVDLRQNILNVIAEYIIKGMDAFIDAGMNPWGWQKPDSLAIGSRSRRLTMIERINLRGGIIDGEYDDINSFVDVIVAACSAVEKQWP